METNNDARGAQNMGSSDHNNVQHNKKADDSTSQKDSGASHTAHNQKKEGEKEVFVPILRTFENDSRHIAKTKGGSELRVLLAREMEQKKLAQQEYIQNTRELLKESLILKDQKRDFLKKKKEIKDTNTTSTASFNTPPASPSDNDDHFIDSIGGAADYVQNIASSSEKKQTPRTQAVRVGDGEDITKELNTIAEEKDSTKDGEVVFHTSNTVKPVKKSGLFGWLRRKKKQTPPQKTTTPPQQPVKNTPATIEKKQPVSAKKESLKTQPVKSSKGFRLFGWLRRGKKQTPSQKTAVPPPQPVKNTPTPMEKKQPVSVKKESLGSMMPESVQQPVKNTPTPMEKQQPISVKKESLGTVMPASKTQPVKSSKGFRLFGWLRRGKKQTPSQKMVAPSQQLSKNTPTPIEKKQPVSVKKESLGTIMPAPPTKPVKKSGLFGWLRRGKKQTPPQMVAPSQQPVKNTPTPLEKKQPVSVKKESLGTVMPASKTQPVKSSKGFRLFGWLRRKKRQTPPQKMVAPSQQLSKNTPTPMEKKQPVSVKKESLGTMMPTSSTQSIKGAPIVGGQQPVSTAKESLDSVQPTSSQDDALKKTTILDRVRGRKRPGDVFTKEERASMEKKQREIVEKEEMRNKWRDFHVKKEKLREQGFRARDVRSYGTTQPERRVLRKQGVAAIILVILILSALVSTIAFVVVRPIDEPGVVDPKDIAPVKDVVTNEQRVLIDVVSSSEDWNSIMRSRADHYTLTQFIPYTQVGQDNVQITFKEFSEFFALNMPDTLFNTFGEYYFVGNYITPSQVNGVFILAVENYGDALVWMLNWEKNAINAFSQVFPDALTQSQPGTTSTVSRAIDNKDVRILSNPESRDQLLYYFFNRSLLVFIVGEEDAVAKINHRIRSANAY